MAKNDRARFADYVAQADRRGIEPMDYRQWAQQNDAPMVVSRILTPRERMAQVQQAVEQAMQKKIAERQADGYGDADEESIVQDMQTHFAGDPEGAREWLGVDPSAIEAYREVNAIRASGAALARGGVQQSLAHLTGVLSTTRETMERLREFEAEAALDGDPFTGAAQRVARLAMQQNPEGLMAVAAYDADTAQRVFDAQLHLDQKDYEQQQRAIEAIPMEDLERALAEMTAEPVKRSTYVQPDKAVEDWTAAEAEAYLIEHGQLAPKAQRNMLVPIAEAHTVIVD